MLDVRRMPDSVVSTQYVGDGGQVKKHMQGRDNGSQVDEKTELASTGEVRKVRYMDYHPRLNIRPRSSPVSSVV